MKLIACAGITTTEAGGCSSQRDLRGKAAGGFCSLLLFVVARLRIAINVQVNGEWNERICLQFTLKKRKY